MAIRKQDDTGNSQQFIMFLHQLHKANPNKKLMIILDNDLIHKSKEVQKLVRKNDWVKLFFLPAYSPEDNPIERFCQWLKQRVYGCKSFSTMMELLQQIRKLVWHFREGRTVSRINFNYEDYADLL